MLFALGDEDEDEEYINVENVYSDDELNDEEKASASQEARQVQVDKWKLTQKQVWCKMFSLFIILPKFGIARYLLRGNIREAKTLLRNLARSTPSQTRPYVEQLVQLLSDLPQPPVTTASAADFTKWKSWLQQCQDARQEFERVTNDGDSSNREYLSDIYGIVTGDDEIIAKLGSFWERFIANLLYREHFRNRSDIANTAEHIFPEGKESNVVYACHSLLLHNWNDALGLFDDFWTQVHLGHLLLTANILVDRDLYVVGKYGSGLDREAITEPVYHIMHLYATQIAEKYGMWKEALAYIGACKTNRDYWARKVCLDLYEPQEPRNILLIHISL